MSSTTPQPESASPSRRILLFLESAGPGGAETMLLEIALELRRRGHHVVHLGPKYEHRLLFERFADHGFRSLEFALRGPVDPVSVWELAQLFRRERFDLINGHDFTGAVYGAAAARLAGIPHVATMHGAEKALEAGRRRMALRWAFRRSRGVIGVSADTSDYMARRLGLPADLFTTIPNGIAPRLGDRAAGRRALGLREQELLVLAVGNLHVRKGHRFLLDALARLGRAHPELPWRVAIAGRGDEMANLQAQVAALGIADRAQLLGHRDDIPDLLAASDVFCMPSLWEGLPVAMLEAMFGGRPVVASAVSGIPEAVRDGTDGLLAPAEDVPALAAALERLLASAEARERFGAAARARAESRFTVAAMIDRYEEVYGWRAPVLRG